MSEVETTDVHTLEESINNIRQDIHSDLCQAIERGGVVCFKKRSGRSRYCGAHSSRMRVYKSFDLPKKAIKKCRMMGCENKHEAKGYCDKHYQKYELKISGSTRKCSVELCEKQHEAKGYCKKHYQRFIIHGDPLIASRKGTVTNPDGMPIKEYNHRCMVKDCGKTRCDGVITRGLCCKHYTRWKRHGDHSIIKRPRKIASTS